VLNRLSRALSVSNSKGLGKRRWASKLADVCQTLVLKGERVKLLCNVQTSFASNSPGSDRRALEHVTSYLRSALPVRNEVCETIGSGGESCRSRVRKAGLERLGFARMLGRRYVGDYVTEGGG
jgi:hypothetical protein